MATCPSCTAPLSVEGDRRTVICIYCNTSSVVHRAAGPTAGGPSETVSLAAQAVSKEDIERIKQLLVDGKRGEAIAHYARVAGVSEKEAEQAVENVMLTAYWTLTRLLPLNVFGFVLYTVLIGVPLSAATWGALEAVESPGYLALVAVAGLFALWMFVRFLAHLGSTLTAAFGSLGRGRVLRSAVVRHMEKQRGFLTVVLFEVIPDDGTAPFVDQETLFLGDESVKKLVSPNSVRVRFNSARDRVFPVTPVTVLG